MINNSLPLLAEIEFIQDDINTDSKISFNKEIKSYEECAKLLGIDADI